MKRRFTLFVLALFFTLSQFGTVDAQTTVTFNVNLKPQLENGDFVPDRGDTIELTGNVLPLRPGSNLRMRDLEPVDSVFSATVTFPRNQQGRTLFYNFILTVDDETLTEDSPRGVTLQGGNINMDALYFGSYAW